MCLADQFTNSLDGRIAEFSAPGFGGGEIDSPLVERDIDLLFGLNATVEQRIKAGRGGDAATRQTVPRLGNDSMESWNRFDQRICFFILLPASGQKLPVDQRKERVQVGRLGELLDERGKILQRLAQFFQVLFGNQQQRLRSERRDVALKENIREEIGFLLQLGRQAFDKLPVALHASALDHDHQFVLPRKFLAVLQVILVILLFRPHQIVPAHVQLQSVDRVKHAQDKEENLRIDKPLGVSADRLRQAAQQTRKKRLSK